MNRSKFLVPTYLRNLMPPNSTSLHKARNPIVALESTIVSHGMPYPQNLETARAVESIIRRGGCEPATIALRDGLINIGLDDEALLDLSLSGSEGRAVKCTTRELGNVMHTTSKGGASNNKPSLWGSTTVASTMYLSKLAGIDLFVTGGSGGVHRGFASSLDVSADVTELARTNVTVVSAGVKSILDVPKTLEYLETVGVTVGVFQSDEFPAFFSPKSGCRSPLVFDSYDEVARTIINNRTLNLPGGFLLACPNPSPLKGIDDAIQQALREVNEQKVIGKDVTPFILKRVADLTEGGSLESNIKLVENNARVGAGVARAVRDLEEQGEGGDPTQQWGGIGGGLVQQSSSSPKPKSPTKKIVVMGGSVIDIIAKPTSELTIRSSTPGKTLESLGGVGRNIAEALTRLSSNTVLHTAVGDDSRGGGVVDGFRALHLNDEIKKDDLKDDYWWEDGIRIVKGGSTATYLALLDGDSDLHAAIADMNLLTQIPSPSASSLKDCPFFVLDANAPIGVLTQALINAEEVGCSNVLLEPTSVEKGIDVVRAGLLKYIKYATPNEDELFGMAIELGWRTPNRRFDPCEDAGNFVVERMMKSDDTRLLVTRGSQGIMEIARDKLATLHSVTPIDSDKIVNVTGCGDTFVAGFVHHMVTQPNDVKGAIAFGQEVAGLNLGYDGAVEPRISEM
jgi:pseudouridine-5'-phosphate glycosidase/pseudouridine kinase